MTFTTLAAQANIIKNASHPAHALFSLLPLKKTKTKQKFCRASNLTPPVHTDYFVGMHKRELDI